jgi:virulence-associated protein VapD
MTKKTDLDVASIEAAMDQLGFSKQSGALYVYLLNNGPRSRGQIFAQVDATDNDLDILVNSRLVNKQFERGYISYYPAGATAWEGHQYDLNWGTAGPGPIFISSQEISAEQRAAICLKIADILDSHAPIHKSVREHKHWDVMNDEEFSQLICEGILESRSEIFAVSRSPRLKQVAPFWAALKPRILKGVNYHRIADLEEVVDHGLQIINRDLELGIDLYILEAKQINHKFYVIDKSLLALFHTDNSQRGVGRITSQWQIIKRYRKHFDRYKTAAIPGQTVLQIFERSADRLIKRAHNALDANEIEWLRSLIRMGKFSQYLIVNNWTEQNIKNLIYKATKQRFIKLNDSGEPIPYYDITDLNLREESNAVT